MGLLDALELGLFPCQIFKGLFCSVYRDCNVSTGDGWVPWISDILDWATAVVVWMVGTNLWGQLFAHCSVCVLNNAFLVGGLNPL